MFLIFKIDNVVIFCVKSNFFYVSKAVKQHFKSAMTFFLKTTFNLNTFAANIFSLKGINQSIFRIS